ncbi:MAG: patatin-like phospholipase family protein [Marinobacterium sp.]|nr:patatin-like phospholipase family protein [Marinobacterium sp.]
MATTVSLVLGSGGARGYAHIGVIDELQCRGYQIVCVAGSSMGALVGGVYAAGALEPYREWVCGLSWLKVLKLLDMGLARGAIRGDKVFRRLEAMLGDVQIDELPVRYTAVATDLTYQKEVWFQHGPLLEAIRASVAVPGFFTPVTREEHILVDGGILNPLPIIPTVAAQADLIIAVDLTGTEQNIACSINLPRNHWPEQQGFSDDWTGVPHEQPFAGPGPAPPAVGGRLDMLLDAVEVMQGSLTQYKIAGYPPDMVIPIAKDVCGFFDFHRAEHVIDAGRQAARHALVALESSQC